MIFEIQHRTELTYSNRISESVMEVRSTPRSDANQTLRRFEITVGPDARVTSHVDWQGNPVHQFSVVAFHDRVVILSKATVETHPRGIDPSLMEDPLRGVAYSYRLIDFLAFHGPVQRDPRIVALAERAHLHDATRVVDAVRRAADLSRDALTYEKGVTNSLTTVAEALDHGRGVCQDFAHLALALLRLVGVPCRYVSGYLHRSDLAEVETHAWCEAFIPSAGWVAFDPTHGGFVGDGHVAVAAGRSYVDVPPNRGVYRGDAEEKIAASVTIQPVDPAFGFGSLPGAFKAPSYTDVRASRPPGPGQPVEPEQQQQQQDRTKAQVQQQRQQQQ